MTVKLVVTDLAGTTVRDPGLVLGAFTAGLNAVEGIADLPAIVALMGVDKREAFATLLDTQPDDPRVETALNAFVEKAVQDATQGAYEALPGVDTALARLTEAGVAVAFTTGFGTEILTAVLETNGWQAMYDGSVASDQVPRGRPAPDLVYEAMRRHNITDPQDVAVIGDTIVDIGCGQNAGARFSIGVMTGTGTRRQLDEAGGIVCDNFTDAVDVALSDVNPASAHGPHDSAVGEILALFQRWGDDMYDEAVTQHDHALQCAALAERDGASDMLTAAALLHDIGHLLVLHRQNGVVSFEDNDTHEQLASDWLSQWFPPAVTEPVRLHVAAKRYLCAVETDYMEGLSDGSLRSLVLQGGPMTITEAEAFDREPYSRDAVALRRWDDQGKELGASNRTMMSYLPLLQRAISVRSWSQV